MRTVDGYITKKKPTGVIWVQFDHNTVGKKTRYENRQVYTPTIGLTWTPIKPVTVQLNVGRTKAAQVIQKQFPSRLAAAKTIYRSQGDTEMNNCSKFLYQKGNTSYTLCRAQQGNNSQRIICY